VRFDIRKLLLFYPNTLLSEFYQMFGAADAEKLFQVFGGTTLQIPSTSTVDKIMRDVSIYETLSRSTSAAQSRRLTAGLMEQHDMKCAEVRQAFNSVRKQIRIVRRLRESDSRVGEHILKNKIKVKRKAKRSL
jgi:hypothetical protein